MEYITSRNNQLIKHIRKLAADRQYRRSSGLFFVEGPKLLAEALRAGAAVEAVVTAPGTGLPGLEGLRQVQVPADLLDSLCDTRSPQGVLFLARMPELAPPERLTGDRWLILDGLQDPGNVGTILRAADAFGWTVFLLPGCAGVDNPKTVRAAMGVHFRKAIYQASLEEAVRLVRAAELPLYAAALAEETADLRTVDLTRCAVVIGSEGRGVSPAALALCDRTVKIPMSKTCESLNAAVAAAVVLWEGARND